MKKNLDTFQIVVLYKFPKYNQEPRIVTQTLPETSSCCSSRWRSRVLKQSKNNRIRRVREGKFITFDLPLTPLIRLLQEPWIAMTDPEF